MSKHFLATLLGFASFTWMIAAAAMLITFGAVLASKDMILGSK